MSDRAVETEPPIKIRNQAEAERMRAREDARLAEALRKAPQSSPPSKRS